VVERERITRVLQESGGNKVAAAAKLGLSRRTLYRRLKEYRGTGVP
jgi:transcriptional regulator of acetoin/glycerol metabolism